MNSQVKTIPKPVKVSNYSPPLVSIVVINFNYGRFLHAAVGSVFAQTYPNVECLIIDDASTDESLGILDEIERVHPSAKIIRRRQNGGHIAAILDGIAHSTGDYLVFLDADDVLFRQFVAIHTYLHLSLRQAVGFTCSDMVQLTGNRMVLGTCSALASFVSSNPPKAAVRPIRQEAAGGVWIETIDPHVLDRAYNVDPATTSWPWSATSAFFFRRDALNLWAKAPVLSDLRNAPDTFFGLAINTITGSVVIDEALGAYRTHGANCFSRGAALSNLRHFEAANEMSSVYKRLLLEEVVREPSRFPFHDPNRLLTTLEALDVPDPPARNFGGMRKSYATSLAKEHYDRLASCVGKQALDRWLRSRRMPFLKGQKI